MELATASILSGLIASLVFLAPSAQADTPAQTDTSVLGGETDTPLAWDVWSDGNAWLYGYNYGASFLDGEILLRSAGTPDGLVGQIEWFGVENVQSYGNWIQISADSGDPTDPTDSTGDLYCIICNTFSLPDLDITAQLNVFSNALPQLEVDTPWFSFGDAADNSDVLQLF